MNLERIVRIANNLDSIQQPKASWAANAIDMAIVDAKSVTKNVGDTYLRTLDNLYRFAMMLDADGHESVANILDRVLEKSAQEKNDYSHLYDTKAHREQTLFQALEDEANTAKEPDLDTWKGGGHSLLTRYSPDYPGVMMLRISDGIYQDMLSKKVYDFKSGFISDTGERYYGGSVANQTPNASQWMSPQILESKHLRSRPR